MRLSICIPTHNRGHLIGELLESIASQSGYRCELEIVVSDNASADDTEAVVGRFGEGYPALRYHRAGANMGADRNFLKVVELATGDFCWLMGSDDRLEPGSVARIERAIGDNAPLAGLSVNRRAYSYAMDTQIHERPVAGGKLTGDPVIAGAEATFAALGEYFGYLSGQVVNRELWNRVVATEPVEDYFNAYVHVYVMGRMLQLCPRWVYVDQPCVGWRSGNDSFMSEGEFRRMMLDVEGYDRIAGDLFGRDSDTLRSVNRVVGTVHVRYHLLGAKLNGAPLSFFVKSAPILMGRYWRYPRFWLFTAPLLVTPGSLVRGMRAAYRRYWKHRAVPSA